MKMCKFCLGLLNDRTSIDERIFVCPFDMRRYTAEVVLTSHKLPRSLSQERNVSLKDVGALCWWGHYAVRFCLDLFFLLFLGSDLLLLLLILTGNIPVSFPSFVFTIEQNG